jgi:3-phenylpropionate/trans-cinnamate dioxygenase ferredoxin reductase component
MSKQFDILIVGAGHGGAQAAIALRQRRFEGTIAIVGEEPEIPYERPPLSKEYFSGEKPYERILIRPAAFWEERNVLMLTSRRVISVDPQTHTVKTEGGEMISYGQLVWATGAGESHLTSRPKCRLRRGPEIESNHGIRPPRSHGTVCRLLCQVGGPARG